MASSSSSPSTGPSSLVLTSALAGETAAASGTYGMLFASTTNPVVVNNAISAVVASTGLVTVPAGVYLVSCGCTSFDALADCQTGTMLLTVSTNTSDYVSLVPTNDSSTGVYSHIVGTASVFGVIWNTSVLGTVIGVANKIDYSSGTAYNNGYLSVTQL